MAESAVSFVVNQLTPFIIQEAKLLKGVRRELEFIKDEMDSVCIFLKDADARVKINDEVKVWVKQLHVVAFRMEDVLDEFRLRAAQQPLRSGVVGWVRKTFGYVKRLKPRHEIATEIEEIKGKLADISQRKDRYQFKADVASSSGSNDGDVASWRDIDALYANGLELVGIDKPRSKLINWLVKGLENGYVFAVVGTGGVGKTTLAGQVFKSDKVKSHFQCHAWIRVSQVFQTEDLLVDLINQFYQSRKESFSIARREMTYLIDVLRNYLRNKRYVAVFDDVWSIQLWDILKHALLDVDCGSRIMLTTRREDVALYFVESPSHIFHLDPLPLEDALPLFYKNALGINFNGKCPQELEKLSEDIVNRSGRLPLSIVAMGGLLRTKEKTVFEWQKFHNSLSSKFGEDPKLKTVMKIISLSYNDLPYYLKSCFLYFGTIPEDCVFPSSLLIPLWIAEGFVKEEKGKTLEEIGQDYLHQLISRNLIQVYEVDVGFNLRCVVHDLMREFLVSRFVDENFCEIFDKNSSSSSSYETNRRLAIHYNTTGAEINMKGPNSSRSLVRSVFTYEYDELSMSFVHTVISTFPQLKILDLSSTSLKNLPDEISNLFHLRYLDLTGTFIEALPNTIGRLQNLQVLYAGLTCLTKLPFAILKLRKLRHLTAFHRNSYAAVMIPEGIGCLTELQTLVSIDVSKSPPSLIADMEKLVQLRDLVISEMKRENGMKFCACFSKMKHLKALRVGSSGEDEVLDLQFVSSPPLLLQSLYLKGVLGNLPNWVLSLTNLVYMELLYSRLSDGEIKMLGDLPKLEQLQLRRRSYEGEELQFPPESFTKLKNLWLVQLDNLNSVTIEKCAMPKLKELTIEECVQLKAVPQGINHLSDLKVLFIIDMPQYFNRRLQEAAGEEDYWKVKHVPRIVIKSSETDQIKESLPTGFIIH